MIAARKPEIMSPAGYWPQLRTAIEAGADSVYFGLKHFTARAKVGFDLGELPEVFTTLHRRGVKGFVTFNTLVFEHEFDEAARVLTAIAESGADAVIVQDVGILKLVREIAPSLEIHASTQMSVTSADGVRLAQSLGASRVTLARELSLDQVRAIRAATDCELEIFVHGALCVAYSGQCFSSEAWGGRSANRGQCAQACRLPYEMVVDGETRPLGDARYLLSPGDLYALEQIPEITQIGISAIKIEGRYKDSDYVALTTRAYRQAVDDAWAGRSTHADKLTLEQVYSRGLAPHFLTGTNHQAVVQGRAPRHRGVLMGKVARVTELGVTLEQPSQLKPGDGVVFDAADWRSPQEPEEGGRVFEVQNGELRFGNGALNVKRIRRGDLVWRTHDPELDKLVRPYTEASTPLRKQPVSVRVTAREGESLVTEWRVGDVRTVVASDTPLGAASQRAVDEPYLREQLGRLGNTPYELAAVELEIAGRPFAPSSLLNRMRREAVERLQEAQSERHPVVQAATSSPRPPAIVASPCSAAPPRPSAATGCSNSTGTSGSRCRAAPTQCVSAHQAPHSAATAWERSAQLHLLVRTQAQLEAAIAVRPAEITLDYLDLYGLKPSLERVRAAGIQARVASPRVLKPGEEHIVDFLLSCDCPILVRSAGLLHALRDRSHHPLAGDFSLNAANASSAEEFFALGLTSLTPTHDLNAEQVADLARAVGGERIEAILYQHLPVFHTEHCVFCRFLSAGTSYKDCGRPCEHHVVALRDDAGRAHPVMADVGCRNTVFGAEAQEASRHLDDWRAAGIAQFRLEFAHESGEQTEEIARLFTSALAGSSTAQELARQLRSMAPQGVTEGSLYVPQGYKEFTILQ
jgi:putative protease